jgi:hypothetical protein
MKHVFMALLLSFFPIMMNQNGHIGFGVDRFQNRMLFDKKKEDEGGGGKGGKAEDDEEEEEEEDDDSESGTQGKNKKKKKSGTSDSEEEDEEEDDQESDLSKLPDSAQKLIKKLRKENQTLRGKAKTSDERIGKIEKALKAITGGEEGDDESPEDKVSKLTAQNQDLAARAAYQELALEHNIGKDQFKYFSFLMSEAISELGDNEEMGEEKLLEIVEQAKAKAPKASNSTSVNGGKNGAGGKGPKKDDKVTAEQFKKMGILQKSKLFRENPDLYNSLAAEVGF